MWAASFALAFVLTVSAPGGHAGAIEQDAYRRLPALDLGVFACGGNPSYQVFSSRAELEKAVAALVSGETCTALKLRFDRSLEKTEIRWDRESLVILEEYYGTGMAKARLELGVTKPGVVDASIVWTVPPPPVTPDTAVLHFAFVVNRAAVE
jgi:hypothetical protein